MNAIMKLSHKSSSFNQDDIYNRLLDMHKELQKSSRNLNHLINQSLRKLQNPKEDNRFSFSAEFQQQNQQQQKEEEEVNFLDEIDEKKQIDEREQILENKIQIYESALITLEEEKQEEIIRKRICQINKILNKTQEQIKKKIQQEKNDKILDDNLNYQQKKNC